MILYFFLFSGSYFSNLILLLWVPFQNDFKTNEWKSSSLKGILWRCTLNLQKRIVKDVLGFFYYGKILLSLLDFTRIYVICNCEAEIHLSSCGRRRQKMWKLFSTFCFLVGGWCDWQIKTYFCLLSLWMLNVLFCCWQWQCFVYSCYFGLIVFFQLILDVFVSSSSFCFVLFCFLGGSGGGSRRIFPAQRDQTFHLSDCLLEKT